MSGKHGMLVRGFWSRFSTIGHYGMGIWTDVTGMPVYDSPRRVLLCHQATSCPINCDAACHYRCRLLCQTKENVYQKMIQPTAMGGWTLCPET
eukprot:scaffold32790_cov24-Prasinocladus_malaysianus.AAC.1